MACLFIVQRSSSEVKVHGHMENKSPLKGRRQGHMTHFKFWRPNDISKTAETRVIKFYTLVHYVIPSLSMTKHPSMGRRQGRMTHFQFQHHESYLQSGWRKSGQILHACRIYQMLAL